MKNIIEIMYDKDMKKTKIIVLIENSCSERNCVAEHGLSIYVETEKHRLLIDAGASENFITNACALGIDLPDVDTLVLSHGHYDHGGGIPFFHKINGKADIYLQETSFEEHLGAEGNQIGISSDIKNYQNIHILRGNFRIDEELFIFSGVTGRRQYPAGNLKMSAVKNGVRVTDRFDHEQYLVLTTQKGNILFSGCAHNGILNILDKYYEIYRSFPFAVMSGFHMMKNVHTPEPYEEEDIRIIENTAKELSKMPTVFFTGHCTGDEAFNIMKPILENKLRKISTGSVFMQ